MKKRVIIADVRSMVDDGKVVGHYFAVADNYLNIFKDECETRVAGGPIFFEKFSEIVKLKYNTDKHASVVKNKVKILKNIKQLFAECANDIIILQCSAVATAYWGIYLHKPKTCTLYMIQYNTDGVKSAVKQKLYSLAKAKIDGIICPNNEIGMAYGLPYCVVPDYIYTGRKKNDLPDYDQRSVDFGVFGIIVPDKGVVEVARYMSDKNYSVRIAGYPQTEQIRQELQNSVKCSNNIELDLDYLSEDEYDSGIRNSKYCILNYSGAYSEHSSGVVFDILFRGVPVIGKKCKSLEFIEHYDIGYIFDDINDVDFSQLLNRDMYNTYLSNIEKYWIVNKKNMDKLQRFILKNNKDAFKKVW